MTEEVQMAYDEAKALMEKALNHLNSELTKVRAGKASRSMLDTVAVDYYGSMTKLGQVANINTPDAKTLSVQPWEKAMLEPIAKAIIDSNLGLNPMDNGEMLIINVPMLTEERRKDLAKKARSEGEHAKVSIRNARKEANDFIKSEEKNNGLSEDMAKTAEAKVQDLTNSYNTKVEEIIAQKEKDIMTV